GNDYGDFMGLDFTHGSFFPCWVDNSRTLPGNTDLPNFDIATARVLIPAPPAPQPRLFYPLRYVFNPATGLYSGNLTLTNVGAGPLIGPVTLVFPKLPPGVTLVNPTGFTASGAPFIKVNFGVLFKNQSIAIPIVLSDPLNVPLSTFFIGFPVTLIFG
ncbi:MAG TPA: hypothetical protein VFA26_07280, partial [Gemmataceae bacterium]|nr:hypothetical protein [Gemmataceae bacterium]